MTTTSLKRTAVAIGVGALLAPVGYVTAAEGLSTKTIKLQGEQFSPRSVSIKKGGKVAFKWAGGSHTLHGPHVSVGARSSGTKTVTFKTKGTFTFKCTLHSGMTTKVKVT